MAGEINFGLLDPNGPAKVGNAFFQGQQELQQRQQGAMQNKLAQLSLGQKQKEIEDSGKLSQIFRDATNPDGTQNASKLYAGAAQAGIGDQIPALQKRIAEAQTAQLTQKKAEIDQHLQNFEVWGQIMGGVKDQAGWTQGKQKIAETLGPDAAAHMPDVYDPATIEQSRQQAMSTKDQLAQASKVIEQKLAADKFTYEQKNDAEDRKVKIRGQDIGNNPIDLSSPDGQKQLDYWADVVKKGGQLPPGLARGKEGSAFVREVTKRAALGDTTPDDLMNNQAEFGGKKAGQNTLGKRQAQIEMAATEAYNLMPIAVKASEAVDRTSYPTLNRILLAADKGTGDANVVQLAVATNSLVNAYTRAISPTGNPTVSDKDHARQILDDAYSNGQYSAAVDMMKKEIEAARKSPNQVRADMRGSGEQKSASLPATNSQGWALHVDAKGNKAYVSPDGKQFQEVQ